jgi:hypothetical protein
MFGEHEVDATVLAVCPVRDDQMLSGGGRTGGNVFGYIQYSLSFGAGKRGVEGRACTLGRGGERRDKEAGGTRELEENKEGKGLVRPCSCRNT